MTYGARLRELRAERQLSLREVEERGGPNKDTMSLIERGVHKPQPQTLGRIAKALDMSVSELRSELEAAEHPLAEAPSSQLTLDGLLLEERRFRPNTREVKGLELFCTRVERRIDSGRMTPNEIEIAWEAIDGFVAVVAATMSDAVFKRFISLGHRILEAAKELEVREDAEARAGATRLEEWKNRRAAS